jgi:hypothetical protein
MRAMTPPDPRARPWLTTAEVAELTREPISAWWRMAREGTAPVAPLRVGKRALRWPTHRLLDALGLVQSDGGDAGHRTERDDRRNS